MRIFRDLWWFFKEEKKSYTIGIMALLMLAVLHLFAPYAVRVVVDKIAAGTLTLKDLLFWTSVNLVVAGVKYGLGYLWRIQLYGASGRLGRLLRDRLFAHFVRMSPSFFHQRRTGDLMAHATNDIQAIVDTAGDGVLTLADSIITGCVVVFTMAVFIDWKLTLVSLLPMPLMAWATGRYGSWMHRRFLKAQEAFSSLNDKVQENITGVRVIRAFGQEKAEKEAFETLLDDVVDKNVAVARIDALFDPTIMLVVGFSFFLTVAFGAHEVLHGELSIGALTQFTVYLGQLIWPMLAFGWLMNIVERGRASYDRVKALLEVRPEITDREDALDMRPEGEIEFRIRSFSYPESAAPALRNVVAVVRPGEMLGIAGRTGSGKTTLFRLLLREFEGAEAEVRIGGVPISRYKLSSLREAIGYVPQDHVLFSATVAENIAFAKPDAAREEVERVARLACIDEDILRFEHGYDTLIGERGVMLSGGQKQRISIARALLLDPDILILDDALSAVDAKTEHQILENLRRERAGKTTLIASHRLSALEMADQILVLEDGTVTERGTHRELMEQNGWYREMFERQRLESEVKEGGESIDFEASAPLS
jgi:ATP-binding cassette subfamily B protein